MSKISIINACTDLGVNIDGAKNGSELLTKDLVSDNIYRNYSLKSNTHKDKISTNKKVDTKTIQDFVQKFDSLLLDMHELHFEKDMNNEKKNDYYTKMHNLVLAVKDLDEINEKRNLKQINEFNEKLYNLVQEILSDNSFPLTIGGDHIIAIASSLASLQKNKNLGIIWFDAHADYNTYKSSVTGNLHGLPLAVATNYEKTILSDFHNGPFYNPKNTVIVGGRDIDPWEWSNVLDAGVTIFSTEDIKKYGIESICKKAFEIASNGTNGVHISFDLDIIDPSVAPGVSVPADNGLNLKETYELSNEIVKYSSLIKSADLVEYNPVFDKDNKTQKLAQEILTQWINNF